MLTTTAAVADNNTPTPTTNIAPRKKTWFELRKDPREVDEKGNTLMTTLYLKQICKEQKGYQTPELNDKIYLHFKGFAAIGQDIAAYSGLKSLWLEGNGIAKIENLETLTELRCLFLQQNCLTRIENLTTNSKIDNLNVSNNMIRKIENLAPLTAMRNLQISHNYLQSAQDIEGLLECPTLSIVDLSHNKIDDPNVLEIFEKMENLAVLNLMGNPVISKIENYRRTLISRLKNLTYLDDRPVFEKERLAVEAWVRGGVDAERDERQRQRDAERAEMHKNFEAMRRLQEEARVKRIAKYGPDEEPVFSPRLEQFRDDMVAKIEGVDGVKKANKKRVEIVESENKIMEINSDDEEEVEEDDGRPPVRSYTNVATDGTKLVVEGENEDDEVIEEEQPARSARRSVMIEEVDSSVPALEDATEEVLRDRMQRSETTLNPWDTSSQRKKIADDDLLEEIMDDEENETAAVGRMVGVPPSVEPLSRKPTMGSLKITEILEDEEESNDAGVKKDTALLEVEDKVDSAPASLLINPTNNNSNTTAMPSSVRVSKKLIEEIEENDNSDAMSVHTIQLTDSAPSRPKIVELGEDGEPLVTEAWN